MEEDVDEESIDEDYEDDFEVDLDDNGKASSAEPEKPKEIVPPTPANPIKPPKKEERFDYLQFGVDESENEEENNNDSLPNHSSIVSVQKPVNMPSFGEDQLIDLTHEKKAAPNSKPNIGGHVNSNIFSNSNELDN